MKNTTKHIATFAAFFIASLPFGLSLSAQNLPTGVYIEKDGVAYRKTATQNNNGTYTIDLEAFVTGKVQYTETADSTDIVLVLDVSGSMDGSINSYSYSEANVTSITGSYLTDGYYWYFSNATEYYYKYEDDEYYQVYVGMAGTGQSISNYHFFLFFTVNGNRLHINSNGEVVEEEPTNIRDYNTNLLNSKVKLYTRSIVSTTTKIQALKDAVAAFIGDVETNAKFDKKGNERSTYLNNQIAIVKFAGRGNNNPAYYDGSTQYTPSGNGNNRGNHRDNSGYNYTEVVRGLTSVLDGGANNLISAVNSLNAGGATAANGGMQLALNILNSIPTTRKSNKVVVFFTDGSPTYSDGFSTTVANEAIHNSRLINAITYTSTSSEGETTTTHPSVFSVGVFDAKPEPDDDIYKFMDRISSNFPDADNMTSTYTRASSDYYKDASGGAADLKAIFKAIAGSAASQDAKIDSSSVVTVDVVSNSFSVPSNAEDAELEVLVAPCNGRTKIGDNYYLTFGEAKTPDKYGLKPITPHINADTVSTTGFDFSANFCGPDESTTPVTYRGYKQIIRFKINVKDDAVGGPNVETNEKASGIYVNGEQIAEFNRPTVKLPVQIWIQKQGLSGDDSAVFTLYRCPFEGFDATDVSNNDWVNFTKVVVNAKDMDENGMVKIVGLDPDYFYKLKEDAWAFGYTYQDGGVLYTVGDNVKNPFVFVNVPNNTKFAEATARNVFKEKKSTTEGGDSGEQK